MALHIVNGPNLNLLGQREPEKYGHASFEAHLEELRGPLQRCKFITSSPTWKANSSTTCTCGASKGIVLNAGGYTHTSVALRDAVAAISSPVMDAHHQHPRSGGIQAHEPAEPGVQGFVDWDWKGTPRPSAP